jgi:hypothetical protein
LEGMYPRRMVWLGLVSAAVLGVWLSVGSVSAFAAAESHPQVGEFGSFANPNGIAIDETSGDVYVADIGSNAVYKFDASGNPVNFTCGAGCSTYVTGNKIAGTSAGAFSFPSVYGNPAAIAFDNSTDPADPSAGDLYVMDAGSGVIDKFSANGQYLSRITGFEPATGSAEHELLGLAVDANGTVHADLSTPQNFGMVAVYEFDDSSANHLVAEQVNADITDTAVGVPTEPRADGFAVGPTGDDYVLDGGACSCTVKFGQQLSGLGQVDKAESGDVAVAADPATNHVYVDDQSSVVEWDTGAINASKLQANNPDLGEEAGTPVASFGSLQLSGTAGQGGIAVNGRSGDIYVSNPANGMVYIFGSDVPPVTVGAPTDVTKETATVSGTVDPRGSAVASCVFEYGLADEYGRASYEHSVSCKPAAGEIGAGSSPVEVSADIEGLEPGQLYRFRLVAGNADGSGQNSGLIATAGPGFGVHGFEVEFLNKDGSPDTQAGSHPYEMQVNFEFSSRYLRKESNADSIYAREPDGTVKDIAVDLPPGLVGFPNATPKKCTLKQLNEKACPTESSLGHLILKWSEHLAIGKDTFEQPVYNMVPPRGVALQAGINYIVPNLFIDNAVQAGGDYPVRGTLKDIPPAAPVLTSRLTLYGVVGSGEGRKPFLTMPTGCHGPLYSSIELDSYQEPGHFVKTETLTRNASGTPVTMTGCSKLLFPPEITVAPDSTNASTSSGLTVGVHVPQNAASNPDGLAESALRDTTVTLPEGVTINPAGGDGLEACSEGLAGFTGFSEFNSEFEPGLKTATFTPELPVPALSGVNVCPDGSKIGTVKIKTPLLDHEIEGTVYLASQNANPFGSLVAMYMIFEDPITGSFVKLTGEVSLTATGQIVTRFKNTPDIPFEELQLHFFGGERAPLATPTRCGTYTTQAVFQPWNGNGPVTAESSFKIDHGPNGTPCPGTSLPFAPSLTAGTTSIQAGGFSPFTMTMSREDGQQNLQAISLKMPPGLSGLLTGVELCPEPQADQGTCGPNSQIGETIVSVGVGNDPFSVRGGKVYLTGPYKGAPFGLSIVNPAKAGPYDVEKDTSNPNFDPPCDCLVVRAKIEVDPITADLTITSDNEGPYKIPTILDGIPLEIKHVNVTITRPSFTFNPTNCNPLSITGSLSSTEGGTDALSLPFQATNCAVLAFKPGFKVSTSGKTSRKAGASLAVKLTYPSGSLGKDANIKSVKVDLPKQLPSRLTTLQKACTAAQFEANPASCPADSRVGHAEAITPLIPVPLEGPAYFVSHGGAKFPELIVVLQGYGVTLNLHGETFINKAGITSSTFRTIPDAPVGTFELTLPQGPFSALAANGNLCKSKLKMPTAFVAQNGAVIHENTPIGVTGCAKHKAKKTNAHKRKGHIKKKR